jgi:hypothetical protein
MDDDATQAGQDMTNVMRSITVTLALGLATGCTGPDPDTACDRGCLIDLADRYLTAVADNDPAAAPLAEDFVFVENLTRLAPGQGIWETATGGLPEYRIDVPDPARGAIGLIAVIERETADGVAPALLAARLEIEDGRIAEAEHLVSDVPPEANMADLAAPRPALTAVVPEDERLTRTELEGIAGSYYEALDRSDGSLAPFADDCERQENGMITAAWYLEPEPFDSVDVNGDSPPAVARDCFGQMNSGRFAYIDSIDNRRIVAVDPVRGLAMGFSHFRQSMANGPHRMVAADGTEVMWDEQREPYDLPAAHIFRIADGMIHEVEAIGIFVDYDSPTGWE